MTLVEVLVAMTVLLVGIWGVARGFPLLMRTVREEGRRTQMTRLAQATMERLTSDPAGLPPMVLGGPTVSPESLPIDPDSYRLTDNPANARDDIYEVVGEIATIPALPAGASPAMDVVYPLKIGRANPAVAPAVSQVFPLTDLPSPPPGGIPAGCYYLAPDGTVAADPSVARMLISYAWRDTAGGVHYVQQEELTLTGSPVVAAAGVTGFQGIVEGTSWGSGLRDFTVLPPGAAVGPGEAALDITGSLLHFDPADSGAQVRINYSLLREAPPGDTNPANQRRARELWEDRILSAAEAVVDSVDPDFSFVTVQLTASGLNSEVPLSMPAAPGINTHVLALDLATGVAYWEGNAIDVNTGVDYNQGRVTIRVPTNPPAASLLGHPFRFFYKTLDDAMLTVIRPPQWYWPAEIFGALSPTRCFSNLGANAGGYTVLDFTTGVDPFTTQPISASQGVTVAVDYTYGSATNPQRVMGELHTIGPSRQITLNNPNVQSVIAVRGVSLRVRAWWRSQTGRLQFTEVDNIPAPPA